LLQLPLASSGTAVVNEPAAAGVDMAHLHRITEVEIAGFPARCLTSPDDLAASYVPGAGMVCCSLRHRGEELLGQRKGLASYARSGSTMGIPLLHPWANRLDRMGYTLGGTSVDFPAGSPLVHDDGTGLPIHGLLGGSPHCRVSRSDADADAARLSAELDFGAQPDLMALFPFPHVIAMDVTLRGSTLTVVTTVRATGDRRVPVAFGYHPYFQLPGIPRAEWHVDLPVRRRMRLDDRCLPTGEDEPATIPSGPLGTRTYDDLFTEIVPRPTFALSGGGRRIGVMFGDGYSIAVVYAPASDDVVCFEPMTAPTNPFSGGVPLTWVLAGDAFSASFRITVD
jgi:aldose 1-epimerase